MAIDTPVEQRGVTYSVHALRRMQQRALSRVTVEQAMLYGREALGHDTVMYVVGRAEVAAAWRSEGVRIEHLEGVHVVCAASGVVLTAYRNRALRGWRALEHAA